VSRDQLVGYVGPTGYRESPTGRQPLEQSVMAWSVSVDLTTKQIALFQRWERLRPKHRRASRPAIAAWLVGRVSDDDLSVLLQSYEREGQSELDADQGILATTRKALEPAAQAIADTSSRAVAVTNNVANEALTTWENRWPYILAGLGVVVLVGGGIWWWSTRDAPNSSP
jgi:hypothetical protein